MKKLLFIGLILLAAPLFADWLSDNQGLDTFSSYGNTSSVAISTAGARTCLTSMAVSGENNLIFAVMNGALASGATFYSVGIASSTAIFMNWGVENPLCGDFNKIITIYPAPIGSAAIGATKYRIGVNGYYRKK